MVVGSDRIQTTHGQMSQRESTQQHQTRMIIVGKMESFDHACTRTKCKYKRMWEEFEPKLTNQLLCTYVLLPSFKVGKQDKYIPIQ